MKRRTHGVWRRERKDKTNPPSALANGHRSGTSWPHRLEPLGLAKSGCKDKSSEKIVPLQIFKICQDFVKSHSGAKQLKQNLDRVAKPTDARFAVADRGINRNARK